MPPPVPTPEKTAQASHYPSFTYSSLSTFLAGLFCTTPVYTNPLQSEFGAKRPNFLLEFCPK